MKSCDVREAEKFSDLCAKSGVDMTPENALRCIAYAKQAMTDGLCSVEAYYIAKKLILEQVEVANHWVN